MARDFAANMMAEGEARERMLERRGQQDIERPVQSQVEEVRSIESRTRELEAKLLDAKTPEELADAKKELGALVFSSNLANANSGVRGVEQKRGVATPGAGAVFAGSPLEKAANSVGVQTRPELREIEVRHIAPGVDTDKVEEVAEVGRHSRQEDSRELPKNQKTVLKLESGSVEKIRRDVDGVVDQANVDLGSTAEALSDLNADTGHSGRLKSGALQDVSFLVRDTSTGNDMADMAINEDKHIAAQGLEDGNHLLDSEARLLQVQDTAKRLSAFADIVPELSKMAKEKGLKADELKGVALDMMKSGEEVTTGKVGEQVSGGAKKDLGENTIEGVDKLSDLSTDETGSQILPLKDALEGVRKVGDRKNLGLSDVLGDPSLRDSVVLEGAQEYLKSEERDPLVSRALAEYFKSRRAENPLGDDGAFTEQKLG